MYDIANCSTRWRNDSITGNKNFIARGCLIFIPSSSPVLLERPTYTSPGPMGRVTSVKQEKFCLVEIQK